MATSDGVLWHRDPHTAAKHEVLARYYDAWFPIMLSRPWVASLTVFEGFAGPGEYLPEEPGGLRPEGSPLIALRALLDRSDGWAKSGKTVRFVFLEKDGRSAEHLQRLVAERFGDRPSSIMIETRQGDCGSDALPLLEALDVWGQPVFANLDPFDAFVPLNLVEKLGSNPASEALVTFMTQRLVRFARVENITQGDSLFGDKEWRAVHDQPTEEKEGWLVERYRRTLAHAGLDKVAGFKLINRWGMPFWLLHATRHPLGIRKMKDAMWRVDPITGYVFRDPRDPGQLTLGLETWLPHLEPLRIRVMEYLKDQGRMPVSDVRSFALYETVYKESHANEVLKSLIGEGRVGREPATGRLANDVEVWPIESDLLDLFM